MKQIYALALVLFLASCGTKTIVTTSDESATITKTSQDITQALSSLPGDTVKWEWTVLSKESWAKAQEGFSWAGGRGNKWPKAAPIAVYEGGQITDEERTWWKVVELETTYISPKTEVIMNISYTLDENDKLSKLEVTSPNYTHMPKFHNGLQNTIGMTLEEAAEYHVSGSSLSSVAFKNVLKSL